MVRWISWNSKGWKWRKISRDIFFPFFFHNSLPVVRCIFSKTFCPSKRQDMVRDKGTKLIWVINLERCEKPIELRTSTVTLLHLFGSFKISVPLERLNDKLFPSFCPGDDFPEILEMIENKLFLIYFLFFDFNFRFCSETNKTLSQRDLRNGIDFNN